MKIVLSRTLYGVKVLLILLFLGLIWLAAEAEELIRWAVRALCSSLRRVINHLRAPETHGPNLA